MTLVLVNEPREGLSMLTQWRVTFRHPPCYTVTSLYHSQAEVKFLKNQRYPSTEGILVLIQRQGIHVSVRMATKISKTHWDSEKQSREQSV